MSVRYEDRLPEEEVARWLYDAVKRKELDDVKHIIKNYVEDGGDAPDLVNFFLSDIPRENGEYEPYPVDYFLRNPGLRATFLRHSRWGTSLLAAVRHWHADDCNCRSKPEPQSCGVFEKHPSTNEIVRFLLHNGADPEIDDYTEKDAFQLATLDGLLYSDPAPETLDVIIEVHAQFQLRMPYYQYRLGVSYIKKSTGESAKLSFREVRQRPDIDYTISYFLESGGTIQIETRDNVADCCIRPGDKHIGDKLRSHLLGLGWTETAIQMMEQKIIFSEKWIEDLKICPISGKIYQEQWVELA